MTISEQQPIPLMSNSEMEDWLRKEQIRQDFPNAGKTVSVSATSDHTIHEADENAFSYLSLSRPKTGLMEEFSRGVRDNGPDGSNRSVK